MKEAASHAMSSKAHIMKLVTEAREKAAEVKKATKEAEDTVWRSKVDATRGEPTSEAAQNVKDAKLRMQQVVSQAEKLGLTLASTIDATKTDTEKALMHAIEQVSLAADAVKTNIKKDVGSAVDESLATIQRTSKAVDATEAIAAFVDRMVQVSMQHKKFNKEIEEEAGKVVNSAFHATDEQIKEAVDESNAFHATMTRDYEATADEAADAISSAVEAANKVAIKFEDDLTADKEEAQPAPQNHVVDADQQEVVQEDGTSSKDRLGEAEQEEAKVADDEVKEEKSADGG